MIKLICDFLTDLNRKSIYNEFSFQHELGIYLRKMLNNLGFSYLVEFERNVSYFRISGTTKKEIDIVIYQKDSQGKITKKIAAIELKYHPKPCAVKNRMKAGIADIQFMEELKQNGFEHTYVCCITGNESFFKNGNRKNSGNPIYGYYRNQKQFNGVIGHNIINGTYTINWADLQPSNYDKVKGRKYYVLEMQ